MAFENDDLSAYRMKRSYFVNYGSGPMCTVAIGMSLLDFLTWMGIHDFVGLVGFPILVLAFLLLVTTPSILLGGFFSFFLMINIFNIFIHKRKIHIKAIFLLHQFSSSYLHCHQNQQQKTLPLAITNSQQLKPYHLRESHLTVSGLSCQCYH